MENLQNQKSNEELVAIPEKYMLTIREAASYFNIGIKNMRRLCESNEGEFSVLFVGVTNILFVDQSLKHILIS